MLVEGWKMIIIYILYFIGVMVSLIIFGYINADSYTDNFGILWIMLAFIWPILIIFTAIFLVFALLWLLGELIWKKLNGNK